MRESIIEHKSNMFYVELREDYLRVCQQCSYQKQVKGQVKSKSSPYCKALILAIMENWTNNKRGSGKLAVFMSYRQWSDEMYSMFGRTTIIDSIDELIGEGLLSREAYKMSTGQDTFQYILNYKEVNKRIRDLPECEIATTRPKVDMSHPSTSGHVPVQKGMDTHPQVVTYPSTSGHNIASTQNQPNINIERGSTALRANNNSPVAEKVKETKMPFTEEEQVFWSLLCEARTLQEKRLYRELERWSKPTKLQREQITAILQKLQENGFSVRSLTPEMIEQAWIDEMEVRSYLKRDPEWKVGNLESALLTYLKQYAPVATEKPVATPVSPEDLSSTVLWTKTPHLLLGSLEQYWPILEWMPEREARKHRYGEYEPLSAEEIERYRQLAGQQEPKRLRLV